MRTIDDIKIIVYRKKDSGEPMVRNFMGLSGKEFIECDDTLSPESAAERLRRAGVPSKEVVILKRFMGRLIQRCPGTPGMICCNYMVMNTGFNCLYDCAYCFLNTYLNSYGIVQFVNQGIAKSEADALARRGVVRIGTGEFTDSLMFDQVTGTGESLIRSASRNENLFLELKTKSCNIEHLLSIPCKGNTVLSWSLSTVRNIEMYEGGAAGLEQRILAAAAACRAGYLVAFHFDPIIVYPDWEREYTALLDRLFHAVEPERVAWISLGCFRHSPGFKEAVHGSSRGLSLTTEEMFPGPDGKFRYLKGIRIRAYRFMLDRIRSYGGDIFVYLCMESGSVWHSVFKVEYNNSDELECAFCDHLKKRFIARGTRNLISYR
jgi:spore photoproduct lyase